MGRPELDSLLELARYRSAMHRNAMTEIADALLDGREGRLSDRDRALMRDVLRKLIADIEHTIRSGLAQRLAERRGVQRDFAVAVANVQVEVAYPALIASGALRDVGLIEAIEHRIQAHKLSTFLRKRNSEATAAEATTSGEIDVIARLLNNPDATISRGAMEYLVGESKRVDTFQNPLIVRQDLPSDVLENLYWWVAAALRRHFVAHFTVDWTALDDAIESAVAAALGQARGELKRLTATEALIEEMARRRELSVPLLVQLLRQGEVSLFEAGFARVTRLNLRLVGRMLYEPGGEALAIACKSVGFTRASFITVFKFTRLARLPPEAGSTKMVTRLVKFFDRVPRRTASAVVRLWRRDRAYLHAIKRVDGKGRP